MIVGPPNLMEMGATNIFDLYVAQTPRVFLMLLGTCSTRMTFLCLCSFGDL